MNLKIENWKLLALSAFYFIFAIISYTVPANEFLSFFRIGGLVIAVVGALQTLIYFFKKDYMKPQDFSFSLGLLLIFAGLVVSAKAEFIVLNYRPVIAVAVGLDSFLRLQYSMNLLRVNDSKWQLNLFMAVLPAVCGVILVLVDLGAMMENCFSFLLIFDGIANVFTVLYYKRFIRCCEKQFRDTINKIGEEESDIIVREDRS